MIKLEVAEYCHGCPDFDPVVHTLYFDGVPSHQIVHCVNSEKCTRIGLYIHAMNRKGKNNEKMESQG